MNLMEKVSDDNSPISKMFSFFTRTSMEAASYALILMTLIVALNSLLRMIPFVKNLNFVEEYSGYLFVFISFFGLADTLREGAHVRVNLVISNLGVNIQDLLDILTSTVSIFIIGMLLYHASMFFIEGFISGETAQTVKQTPLWIPRFFLIPGYLFLIFEIMRHLSKALIRFRSRATKKESM